MCGKKVGWICVVCDGYFCYFVGFYVVFYCEMDEIIDVICVLY